MKILAFETSCDDTSIALFENADLIAMSTKSQIRIHNKTWGVVPEVASREHANAIFDVIQNVLEEGNITLQDIDYIGVTTHPWLIPSLLTGMTVASTLSETLQIPIIPINHIEAHIFSNFLERQESDIEFPLVCLTVSGGHNDIYYMSDMWSLEKLWSTQDDASGEAFDKVAKMMWLGYPGGPIISQYAEKHIVEKSIWLFPRVWLDKGSFGFSFSWLKSSVKREIDMRKDKNQGELTQDDIVEISYEFQEAVTEVLAYKILEAAKQKGVKTVCLTGWVSANDVLREKIKNLCAKEGFTFICPTKKVYCMDNAAMVGILTYYRAKYQKHENLVGTVEIKRW